MQLVAYGAQDIYLTGNPQITFFKVVYRRHTNFSMEAIEQTFTGTPAFNSEVVATVSRNGDLVHRMYVEFSPTDVIGTGAGDLYHNVGHTLLKEMEVEIGGQKIDKHYSHWLTTWNELTDFNPTGAKKQMSKAVNAAEFERSPMVTGQSDLLAATGGVNFDEPTLYQLTSFNHIGVTGFANTARIFKKKAFVPLQFWFCRNVGLALPLIALQYHEVKVKVTFCADTDIRASGAGSLSGVKLWADYIYLDTDERRRFAQVSHEYLIEQLQTQTLSGGGAGDYDLNFNHPVKELIWIGTPGDATTLGTNLYAALSGPNALPKGPGTPSLVLDSATAPTTTFKLKLNGHDRFKERLGCYFTRTQVNQHHSGYGGTSVPDSIAVYSFALKPEEHQPSGTCNFSRIDNAQLSVSGDAAVDAGILVYAVNYNVLRIMSGMGGLAYSN